MFTIISVFDTAKYPPTVCNCGIYLSSLTCKTLCNSVCTLRYTDKTIKNMWRATTKGIQSRWQRTALHAWTSCVTQFCQFRVNQLFRHFGHSFTSTELLGADFHKKWLKSVIFRLAVGLNVAYFTWKHAVFKRCSGWSHCDKGHVWRINGNLVFPRILSLPLNERSLFLSRVNRLQIW